MIDQSDSGTSVELQVAGANERDVGKGTARISREAMTELGIQEGDIVEIEGDDRTAAVALPPYRQDEGIPVVRLDGLLRSNAGVSIGDHVELREADPIPAEKIVVAPAQEDLRVRGSGQSLLRTLNERPLSQGDVISTSVYRQSPDMDQQQFPDEIFRRFFKQRAFGLREIRLVVVETDPGGIVQVTPQTEIELRPEYEEPTEPGQEAASYITYDDIGGLDDAIEQVREMVELPLKSPELFERLGIDPPKGVLLHGPPGTGKTMLARAVANESEASFYPVHGPEIMGKYYGESEERLREVFEEARQNQPAIVFFDEIDSIAPKREEVGAETERRVVAQLLTLMDGLEPRENVVVIATTNQVDQIDEALRRPGRFDREIVIGVPSQNGRREILNIHTRGMPLEDDVDLEELSHNTYGFVGADLASLTREAAIESLREKLPEIRRQEDGDISEELLENLTVSRQHFQNALKRVQPSAMREITVQAPDVTWDDVGGVEEAKETLREGVELPLTQPDSFRRLGIRPAKGFLMFGPPGTGKTLMAKAVAREAEANFVGTKSSDLLSKWYGESEKQLSRLFDRARQVSPTIIFIDELDSMAPERGGRIGESGVTERVVNTLLAEMDGLETLDDVVVIGATNRPNLLDPALLRPGRFDEVVYVPMPDEGGREEILRIHTREMPLADDVDLGRLAARTTGYTGADLENVARRAGMLALRENADADEVPMELFDQALSDTRASVTSDMEDQYEKMLEELKQEEPGGGENIGFARDRE